MPMMDGMCDGMAGMGLWGLLLVVPLLTILVLAVLGSLWLFRHLRQAGPNHDSVPSDAENARELLRRRYAAGEINDEEYERRLTALTTWR